MRQRYCENRAHKAEQEKAERHRYCDVHVRDKRSDQRFPYVDWQDSDGRMVVVLWKEINPCKFYGIKTRSGRPCKNRAMAKGRFRMHGGKSTRPPLEKMYHNKNAVKTGEYETIWMDALDPEESVLISCRRYGRFETRWTRNCASSRLGSASCCSGSSACTQQGIHGRAPFRVSVSSYAGQNFLEGSQIGGTFPRFPFLFVQVKTLNVNPCSNSVQRFRPL